ncbi:MAG: pyridoxamine 5'-phosphate oxidase family protein [Betaproteobacteria bacterium]|nr:pyridoxamine 5'-phosphate oxidase family protein [Betaproteobacteria bacterium]
MILTERQWQGIRQTVARAGFCAVASVNADGSPHLTPIGSVWLEKQPGKAMLFQRFTRQLPENAQSDDRVCLLATRNDAWFWIKALLRGRFDAPPGVRIVARLGPPRPARPEEIARFHGRMSIFRWTRGFRLLWADLRVARDLSIESVLPVKIGPVSEHG